MKKRHAIRDVVAKHKLHKHSNKHIVQAVKEIAGIDVLETDVVHAIGGQKLRVNLDTAEVRKAVKKLFAVCRNDAALVRWAVINHANVERFNAAGDVK